MKMGETNLKKIILMLTILVSLFYLTGCNNKEVTTEDLPEIVVNGDSEVTILVNENYGDPGATIVGNFRLDITVDSNLINTIPGTYHIVYSITYLDEIYQATRTIIVIDPSDKECPLITLNGSAILYLDYQQNYIELGAEFSDNVDTEGVVVVGGDTVNTNILGTYSVTYNAQDSSGNEALEVVRTIIVEDVTSPLITLNGDEVVHVEYDTVYTELSAVFSDDHDQSGSVTIGGDVVNTSTLGTYTITYNAVDQSGNIADEVERTVLVEDTTVPVLTLVGPSTMTVEFESEYTESGATFLDNYDSSGIVVVGGDVVDTSVPGTYTVTYDAVDSNGNHAEQVTRIVTVSEQADPA